MSEEKIERFLGQAHTRGALLVLLCDTEKEKDEPLNEWSLEGVESSDLPDLATEIHEFCSSDVDASGTRTAYQLHAIADRETLKVLSRSPRLAYVPQEVLDGSPTTVAGFNKQLMAQSVGMLRVAGSTFPAMLQEARLANRELMNYLRDQKEREFDALRAVEKARSKDHKRRIKELEAAEISEMRTQAFQAAMPHMPKILGGLSRFVLMGGDTSGLKQLMQAEEPKQIPPAEKATPASPEVAERLDAVRGALALLTMGERVKIEGKLEGLLDKLSELLQNPNSEELGEAVMSTLSNPWNGCDILENVKAALGEERFGVFGKKVGLF